MVPRDTQRLFDLEYLSHGDFVPLIDGLRGNFELSPPLSFSASRLNGFLKGFILSHDGHLARLKIIFKGGLTRLLISSRALILNSRKPNHDRTNQVSGMRNNRR